MADLQDLLSRLKSAADDHDTQAAAAAGGYQQPTVSSPVVTPSHAGPQPHHASAIMSPNTSAVNTPVPEQPNTTKPADLLSLLRFKQSSGSVVASPSTSSQNIAAPSAVPIPQEQAVSDTDPVASFVRKPSSLGSMASPSPAAPASSRPELRGEASSSSANPQDFLLKLLNQAKPSQTPSGSQQNLAASQLEASPQADTPMPSVEQEPSNTVAAASADVDAKASQAADESDRKPTPMRIFGQPSPSPTPKSNVFTYINPFDQLSSSSPRNRPVPQKAGSFDTPSKVIKPLREFNVEPAAMSARTTSPTPALPQPIARTESVSEKVEEVGENVDKEIKQALAEITSKTSGDSLPTVSQQAAEEVQEAAQELKEELEHEDSREALEAGMPKPMREAFEATIDAVAGERSQSLGEDWEAQASPTPQDAIRVFNFPMKPFISIDIKQFEEKPAKITSDMVTEIARIKKEFDQIDRNLCTATQNFIVYPLKLGGLRIISQDNGQHKQVFSSIYERIFNVQIGRSMKYANSSGPIGRDAETILATGVDGTVFWSSLANFPKDHLYGEDLENRGFVFPARREHENTSGGQLKTRVKASTRNPEFFAYGRGKYIYIIWPQVARSSAYTDDATRRCDSERYFSEHGLRVATGKAGKDFAFSADDTVIASLDKAGKLKFWDIRKLTDASTYGSDFEAHDNVEIKEPITQYLTSLSPSEKCWPTSVMFLDKERPMAKGIALRYVLVGMKQNHTLQLWDLSLGKPVQELNFPHEQESDAICSLAYHSKTGILAVGHPTRNSIYLLHVSAPKYNLPPMSQAKFMTMLANKDKHLPVPDSTIIVSGCREYSLGNRGHLRSLDMLSDAVAMPDDESPPLFELYVMHSRGITNVVITRKKLGWSKEGKIIHPVDALKAGAISVTNLPPPPTPIISSTNSNNGESVSAREPKVIKEVVSREQSSRTSKISQAVNTTGVEPESAVNGGGDRADKKKKKKGAETLSPAQPTLAPAVAPPTPTVARDVTEPSNVTSKPSDTDVPQWVDKLLARIGDDDTNSSVAHFESTVNTEFSNLYRRLAEDRRVHDAANVAKQEAVLRLVSATLNENIEPAFARIVNEQLTNMMLGPLKDIVIQAIDRNLSGAFATTMKSVIPAEIEKTLPTAMGQVAQQPSLLRAVADQLGATVGHHVDAFVKTIVQDKLIPTYTQLAVDAARTAIAPAEAHFAESLRVLEVQRQQDAAKIDHLLKSIGTLQEVISTMAEQQVKFQADIVSAFRQQSHDKAPTTSQQPAVLEAQAGDGPASPGPRAVEKTPEQIERESIQQLLEEGQYEPAAIQWLQSNRQSALFDEIFARLSPQLLRNMSPLVVLSVCTAVSFEFNDHIAERLAWLEVALNLSQPGDKDFVEVYPRIMEILSQRLHKTYMDLATQDMHNPLLRKISILARRANDLQKLTTSLGSAGPGAGQVSSGRRPLAE